MSNKEIYLGRNVHVPKTPAPEKKLLLKSAHLVILRSLDGGDGPEGWEAVTPESVPDFVKAPNVIRRLLHGEMIQDELVDPYWYRAEQVVNQPGVVH